MTNRFPTARSLRHIPALLQGLTYRGVAHFFLSEYDQAVSAETEALQLASESQNAFYLALSRTYLGFSLANQGRISQALSSFNEAVALARRNENRIVLARAPNGIGWIHREIGNLRTAIEYDEACVETARSGRGNRGGSERAGQSRLRLHAGWRAGKSSGRHAPRGLALRSRTLEPLAVLRCPAAGREALNTGWPRGSWIVRTSMRAGCSPTRNGMAFRSTWRVAHRILGEIAAVSGDLNTAEEQLLRSVSLLIRPRLRWLNGDATPPLVRSCCRVGNGRRRRVRPLPVRPW